MLFQQFLSLLSCIQLLFPFFYFPNFFLQIKTKIKKQTAKDRAKHNSLEASSLSFSWHYIFVPPYNKGHCLSRWLGQILSATNHILLSWQRKLQPGNQERVTPEPLPVALWCGEWTSLSTWPTTDGLQWMLRIFLVLMPVKCRISGPSFTSSFRIKALIPPWPPYCRTARREHELLGVTTKDVTRTPRTPQPERGRWHLCRMLGLLGSIPLQIPEKSSFNYWWSRVVLERQISRQIQAKAAFQNMANSEHCLLWFVSVVHRSGKNGNCKA